MSGGYYVLDDDDQPCLANDVLVWGQWFETADQQRVVARDTIGAVRVSTVFLGVDHNWCADGPPILWETLIFGGPHDGWQQRYSSLKNAYAGHVKALQFIRDSESETA